MPYKITTIIALILGLSHVSDALFFGLFGSTPTKKPDVVVSESPKTDSNEQAYQNYLRSLASTYYGTTRNSLHYVPVYTYQPQFTEYTQPQRNFLYPDTRVPGINHYVPVGVKYNLQPKEESVPPSSIRFEKPIIVLPSTLYREESQSEPKSTRNMNKLIEESTSNTSGGETVNVQTIEFNIPEPKISASLYDLPASGISPDFLTGGYVTKTMTVNSSADSNTRSTQKFGHAYTTPDGAKVSEEGHLIQHGNGQETVVKRGQYEHIDATGKQILVKWVADDEGFRIVN